MPDCGICGQPRHTGSCVNTLRYALRAARDTLQRQQQTIDSLEQALNRSNPLSGSSVEQPVRVKSNGFDKTSYMREYMRKRRHG